MSATTERSRPDTAHVRSELPPSWHEGSNQKRVVDDLNDTHLIAYALVQAFKLFISTVGKRWPELR